MDSTTKLKLDLHTHVFEEFFPLSPKLITVTSVGRLVEKIKAMGLDGIAVTEHNNMDFGYRTREIVEKHFAGQVIIIPGREVEDFSVHYVELDLNSDGKTSFRFLAHPGYPGDPAKQVRNFDGIEIDNAMHNWHINKARVQALAAENNLVLLCNSDAHYLRDVGKCFNEVSLSSLTVRNGSVDVKNPEA